MPVERPLQVGLTLALTAWLGACNSCMGDAPPQVELRDRSQRAAVAGSGAAAADEASAAVEPEPMLGESMVEEVRHDAPPTAADFEVVAVDGAWSTFRGNLTRSGLRQAPAITAPMIRWSARVGIQGYANTPVVTEDAIFVASQGDTHDSGEGTDEREGVYRLDPATGGVVWEVRTARDANGIALYGDTLLVGTDGGMLYALDAATGATRWQYNVECNVFHAPLVDNGQVLLPRRDSTARLDFATGAPLGAGLGRCRNGERGIGSAADGSVFMASDYRLIEHFRGEQAVWAVHPVPAAIGDIGAWTPPLLTRNMALVSVHDWSFGPVTPESVLRPAIFAFWKDNAQLAWTIDVNPIAQNVPTSSTQTPFLRAMPWIDGGRLWFTPNNRGELVWFDVTTGQPGGAIALPDCRQRQFSSIVGVPGTGYLSRHDGVLYAFSTGDAPAILWSLSIGNHGATGGTTTHDPLPGGCQATPRDGTGLFATPAIGPDGTLYVGSGDGYLYAIAQQN